MQAQECALNQNHNGGIGMRNSLIAAALVLVLGLSAAGCGTQNAGKSIGNAAEDTLDGMTGTPKNSSR